jgi:MOSC domain-containing protein YiiM
MNRYVGKIEGIAVRTAKNGPMKELSQANAEAGGGIEGDLRASLDRSITLLSADQWAQTMQELNRDLPWHTRRANVLVSGSGLGRLIGHEIQLGSVRVAVKGETAPCGLMEQLCPGLREALTPDCRGGVLGRITQSGTLTIGDEIFLLQEADHEAETGDSAGGAGRQD